MEFIVNMEAKNTVIKQWYRKRVKIAYGFLNTYIRKRGRNYNAAEWWDDSFYTEGISDRQTISSRKSVFTAKYHYASMEMQILKYLHNNGISVDQSSVLDIGSGSGHWIDFYKSLGSLKITGIDVSLASFNYLKNKYSEDANIEIHKGKALEVIGELNGDYDLVNAVGVMFHIVDDSEWQRTIYSVGKMLKKNGLFVIGGHFGLFNVLSRMDKDGYINKRLRSKGRWVHTLRKAGFTSIKIYRNNAYLWINDTLPENSVLIATK